MDALKRAMEMMQIKLNELPRLAMEYISFLSNRVGICMEVYITAFAHYAQAVEGLSCEDEAYRIDPQGIEWFKSNMEKAK